MNTYMINYENPFVAADNIKEVVSNIYDADEITIADGPQTPGSSCTQQRKYLRAELTDGLIRYIREIILLNNKIVSIKLIKDDDIKLYIFRR